MSGNRGPMLLAGGLVAGVLAFTALLFGRSVEKGQFAEAYSTFRATPEGSKAALLVLQRLGYRVERHTEVALALSGADVLFVLEPAAGVGFDAHDVRALRSFVRGGGCLVVAASLETALHREFGLRLRAGGASAATALTGTAIEVVPGLPSAYADGVARLAPDAHDRALENPSATAAAVPIFRRPSGSVEAVAVREGAGKALFFADPSIFANRAIAREGNAALLAAIAAAHARSGRVAFDEFHHGFASERGIVGYLGRRSLAPALAQAGLAFLALVLALGGRRGRPPVLEEERPPESREHIRAMAEIYAKAGLRRECADRLHRALVRDLEAALGASPLPSVAGTPGGSRTRWGPFPSSVPAARVAGPDGQATDPLADALRRRGVKAFRGHERLAQRHAHIQRSPQVTEMELYAFARDLGRFEAELRAALGPRFGENA